MWVVVLFTVGMVGICGMTWLWPIVAGLARSRPAKSGASTLRHVAVLMPVHNEEESLPQSLSSIRAAIGAAEKSFPAVTFSLTVACDGCSDQSERVAQRYGASVITWSKPTGKWAALTALVRQAEGADWVVLVDAGVVWPKSLLAECLPHFIEPDVVGAIPTYRNPGGGLAERLMWNIEAGLKRLEALAGGPVSAHGATCCYRRPHLLQVLDRLETLRRERAWLNDDVVIPLALRATNRAMRIVYLPRVVVRDQERCAQPGPREFARRKRLVIGNIEWVLRLLPLALRLNRAAGLLALRRVFRVLWAYWLLMIVIAATLLVGQLIHGHWLLLPGCVFTAACVAWALRRMPSVRTTFHAAAASLLAPYYAWVSAHGLLNGVEWR